MKGALKAVKRAPHLVTSKVGMASKSSDAEFDEMNRRFTAFEGYAEKLMKDTTAFRDAINNMVRSSTAFAEAFSVLFSPLGNEYGLDSRYPSAAETIKNIGAYQSNMSELQEALMPEVELVESRIMAPTKELVDMMKKIRKAITKRDHKLVDYDRHNNSYTKLRDKKEKSLSDEKNMFKIEQDFEIASQEYEQHNTTLKQELPQFFELCTAFITPLFDSFYYMQLQVIYVMLEKFQAFSGGKYDMSGDVEQNYLAKLGDTAEQIENMAITKRFGSTAIFMRNRATSGSDGASTYSNSSSRTPPPKPSLSSKPSFNRSTSGAGVTAPPAYSPTGGLNSSPSLKRPPPPPPPMAKPKVEICTALYDYAATAEGDLSFNAGDKIELITKTESTEDWWVGRVHGQQGNFPANYVQS